MYEGNLQEYVSFDAARKACKSYHEMSLFTDYPAEPVELPVSGAWDVTTPGVHDIFSLWLCIKRYERTKTPAAGCP